MFKHGLRFVHDRTELAVMFGRHTADSEVDISASSNDLTEACRELLSRMPLDVYQAFKDAINHMEDTRAGT